MRKLKLQAQVSIDGFIAGPNHEMDWMVWNWDDSLKKYVTELTEPVDCIVMGRNLAPGFIPHWAKLATQPKSEQYAFARKMTDSKKVVFTKTLNQPEWDNTTLAKGDLTQEINNLKKQSGGDIIAYGGAQFVSSLIKEGLIDEYYLFVNPSVLGKGLPIFQELAQKQSLTLVQAQAFDCGIALLQYGVKA
jgi:dihydrofolate reductase